MKKRMCRWFGHTRIRTPHNRLRFGPAFTLEWGDCVRCGVQVFGVLGSRPATRTAEATEFIAGVTVAQEYASSIMALMQPRPGMEAPGQRIH